MSEKRRRGARTLNLSAKKHGAHLSEAKRTIRATRDRHRRTAEREARAVLAAAGLADDPLARLVAKQLRRLETMAGRLEDHLERRGYFKRDGSPSPAAVKLVDVVDRLLGEARRLFEGLRGEGRGTSLEALVKTEYVATFSDCEPAFPRGILGAPVSAVSSDCRVAPDGE